MPTMRGYVYILQSEKTGGFYIGSAFNPEYRLKEHNSGQVKSTKYKQPWRLVFYKCYSEIREARQIEYKLKRMRSRFLLERIIADQDIKMKMGD